jgi:hypothetical protein
MSGATPDRINHPAENVVEVYRTGYRVFNLRATRSTTA